MVNKFILMAILHVNPEAALGKTICDHFKWTLSSLRTGTLLTHLAVPGCCHVARRHSGSIC